MLKRSGFMLTTLLLISGQAHAAGFDCAKARTKMEKAICANERLSQLDSDIASAYQRAVLAWDGKIKPYVVKDQREFLAGLRSIESRESEIEGDCPSIKDEACIEKLFRQRLATLNGAAYPMGGVYIRDGSAKLLVYPGAVTRVGVRLFLMANASNVMEGGVGGETETNFPKWKNDKTLVGILRSNSSDTKAGPCEVTIAFLAQEAQITQKGSCNKQDFAGTYTRRSDETLRSYELELY
jgi:uncharacterized protein